MYFHLNIYEYIMLFFRILFVKDKLLTACNFSHGDITVENLYNVNWHNPSEKYIQLKVLIASEFAKENKKWLDCNKGNKNIRLDNEYFISFFEEFYANIKFYTQFNDTLQTDKFEFLHKCQNNDVCSGFYVVLCCVTCYNKHHKNYWLLTLRLCGKCGNIFQKWHYIPEMKILTSSHTADEKVFFRLDEDDEQPLYTRITDIYNSLKSFDNSTVFFHYKRGNSQE